MRLVVACAVCVLLAACESPVESARQAEYRAIEINYRDDATCRRRGFHTGTVAYADCMTRLRRERLADSSGWAPF